MKKGLAILLSFGLAMSTLTGCGGSTATVETEGAAASMEKSADAVVGTGDYVDFPSKNITYICSGSAGGGLDLCARMLAPYLQKYLPGSGTITVENITGGQNWTAWNRLIQSEPDGYTVSTLATPQFCNYLNKSLKIDYTMDDYVPLVNCVTDYCTVCVRTSDERFADVNTLEDLEHYLKENAGEEYLVSLTSGGGADEIAMYEYMEKSGVTNLTGINYADGVSASKTGFLGEETDIYFGKIGDSYTMYQEGKAKILAVLAEERSAQLPDVSTGAEQGYDIVLGSSRGIIVPKGMNEDLMKLLEEACKRASEDPDYLKSMAAGGYEVDFMGTEEYQSYLLEVKQMVEKHADILGYND